MAVPADPHLTVAKSGFETSTVQNIPLTAALVATVNVSLHVGSVSQTVAVSATAVQLESQTSTLQSTITTRAIEDLPNISASPTAYAALAPNVIPTTGQQGLGNAAIGSATNAQMGGGLAQQNGYLVDGAEARGTNENGAAYAVPIEAVSEVRVDTTTYSAEFGRAIGGITQVTTKSGTDQFHGAGWEFLRNAILNANSWQNNTACLPNGSGGFICGRDAAGNQIAPRPALHYDNFGFTFSGPINPTDAVNPANYTIIAPNAHGSFTGPGTRVIPVIAATYNPNANTVTLTTAVQLNVHHLYQLRVTLPPNNPIVIEFGGKRSLGGFFLHGQHFTVVNGVPIPG